MERHVRPSRTCRLRTLDIEINDDRILAAADNYSFAGLVRPRVDLLMRYVRRNIDEISSTRFVAELEMIAPAHASASSYNIEYGFEFAVMVRTGFRAGLDNDGTGPKLSGARPRVSDRRSP